MRILRPPAVSILFYMFIFFFISKHLSQLLGDVPSGKANQWMETTLDSIAAVNEVTFPLGGLLLVPDK